MRSFVAITNLCLLLSFGLVECQGSKSSDHFYSVAEKNVISPTIAFGCTVNNNGFYGQAKSLDVPAQNSMLIEFNYEMEVKESVGVVNLPEIVNSMDRAVVDGVLESPTFKNLCNADRVRLYNNLLKRNTPLVGISLKPGDKVIAPENGACQTIELTDESNHCYIVEGKFTVFRNDVPEQPFQDEVLDEIEAMMNDENRFDRDFHTEVVQIRYVQTVKDMIDALSFDIDPISFKANETSPFEVDEPIEESVDQTKSIDTDGTLESGGGLGGGVIALIAIGVVGVVGGFIYFQTTSPAPSGSEQQDLV